MFVCCPCLHVLQIYHQQKTSGPELLSELACHHTSLTTVDELWDRVEAARASVPVHSIQSLFDSKPKCISSVMFSRGDCSGY
ncbi:hypothetical protein TNCV_2089641 [Trichonephila clavipes]|nr:hypothetical protein TNCV_2089641 [Trichonephila clavipes]